MERVPSACPLEVHGEGRVQLVQEGLPWGASPQAELP